MLCLLLAGAAMAQPVRAVEPARSAEAQALETEAIPVRPEAPVELEKTKTPGAKPIAPRKPAVGAKPVRPAGGAPRATGSTSGAAKPAGSTNGAAKAGGAKDGVSTPGDSSRSGTSRPIARRPRKRR